MPKIQVSVGEIEMRGKRIRFLAFDNQGFDYEIEEQDLQRAIDFCGESEESKKALHGDIQKHFLMSLGDFLGWPITLEELMTAIRTGELEMKGGEACTP